MPTVPRKSRTTKYVRKGNKGVRVPTSQIMKVVKSMAETKAQITSGTERNLGTTLNSPNDWYSLNNIAKGTESHNRVGDKINPTFLDVRGSVMANANKQMYHKVMILSMNKQSDPLTDLLEDTTGAYAPATEDLQAIYARVNTSKYQVLGSRVMKTGTSNGGNSEELTKLFHFKIPLKGVMEYQEDESICQKRRVIIIGFSREAGNDTTLGENVEWTYNAKFYFKDP